MSAPHYRYACLSFVICMAALFTACGSGSNNSSPSPTPSPSGAGKWTWWSGSNLVGASGAYGALGVGVSSNVPGAREFAAKWTDTSGNLWLFGGDGVDAAGTGGLLNDLWRFNPTTRVWVWMGGSSTQGAAGNYGTLHVADPGNQPGARQNPVTWRDGSGKIWLFGGRGFASKAGKLGLLNDLWMFDPSTGNWTWYGGANVTNSSGTYGTRGVADVANAPGARENAVAWVDPAGKLWLFGGSGMDSTSHGPGLLNDLWMYDPAAGTWTWVNGDQTAGTYGTYGSALFPPSGGTPGARQSAAAWADNSGNLWLFGGYGYDSAQVLVTDPLPNVGMLNDLWEYSPKTNAWTWIMGSYLAGAGGSYGTKGIDASSNTPGSRAGSIFWTDKNGTFWLLGGNYFNDLWRFDPDSLKWTWVSGSNTAAAPGDYGKVGVTNASNVPGGRLNGASWVDAQGVFWMFGGKGYDSTGLIPVVPPVPVYPGLLNDMWAYRP